MNSTLLSYYKSLLTYKRAVINLPVFLCFLLCISVFFSNIIDINIKRFFYTISLNIKDILVFFMPFIIVSYMASSIIGLGKKASVFVLLVLACLMASNLFSTLIAYVVSVFTLKGDNQIVLSSFVIKGSLAPLWTFYLPKIISNENAILIGVILGISGVYSQSQFIEGFTSRLSKIVMYCLNHLFIPTVPLFVAGFLLKLGHEGILLQLTRTYSSVFLTIFLIQVIYVLLLYAVASNFRLPKCAEYIRNIFPAAMTAFSTMSSAATIPITLQATENNTKNVNLSRFIIPSTANIHLIGDSIGVPIMAIAIMLSFGFQFPELHIYLIFAVQFVLAKFCIAAVPGGGIIVMVPVIEQYLGFSPEMASIISAFYIFFDPINTAVNVSGNGAFAILMSKISERKYFKSRQHKIHQKRSSQEDILRV